MENIVKATLMVSREGRISERLGIVGGGIHMTSWEATKSTTTINA